MKIFKHTPFRAQARRFADAEQGAVLVEFALVFPLMLLFFAIMIESARTYWSYQIAIGGVRDAARYVARVAPLNICTVGGNLTGYTSSLTTIIDSDLAGTGVFPSTITLATVDPVVVSHTCETAPVGSYRIGDVPVATVRANLIIQFPMGFIFDWYGDGIGFATTAVEDQARIIGQ